MSGGLLRSHPIQSHRSVYLCCHASSCRCYTITTTRKPENYPIIVWPSCMHAGTRAAPAVYGSHYPSDSSPRPLPGCAKKPFPCLHRIGFTVASNFFAGLFCPLSPSRGNCRAANRHPPSSSGERESACQHTPHNGRGVRNILRRGGQHDGRAHPAPHWQHGGPGVCRARPGTLRPRRRSIQRGKCTTNITPWQSVSGRR
jgi:hypothetical protein